MLTIFCWKWPSKLKGINAFLSESQSEVVYLIVCSLKQTACINSERESKRNFSTMYHWCSVVQCHLIATLSFVVCTIYRY